MTTDPSAFRVAIETKRPRIVVIGVTGQLARSLARQAKHHDVIVLPIGRPDLDLTKPATIFPSIADLRPDAIINAAAYTAVDRAETDSEMARQINVDGARHIAASAQRLGIPVIQLSTDYVFDGEKNAPYVEADEIHPKSVYGKTKAEGERAVAAETPNHVIIRTSWVYSPFGKNFVRTILEAARKQDTLRVVHDQCGCPTSALDLAEGILKIAQNLFSNPQGSKLRGTFHMTGRGTTSWANFAKSIFAISKSAGGPDAAVRYIMSSEYPQIAQRPRNSSLNCEHLFITHGVQLPEWRISMKSCVLEILREFKEERVTSRLD